MKVNAEALDGFPRQALGLSRALSIEVLDERIILRLHLLLI